MNRFSKWWDSKRNADLLNNIYRDSAYLDIEGLIRKYGEESIDYAFRAFSKIGEWEKSELDKEIEDKDGT